MESSENSQELASKLRTAKEELAFKLATARQELADKLTTKQLPPLPELKQSSITPASTPAEQATVQVPKPDPRPAVLEDLSTSLMMDENGLLSQFIEYTLSHVVNDAIDKVNDQQSWERAGQWQERDCLKLPKLIESRRSACDFALEEIF